MAKEYSWVGSSGPCAGTYLSSIPGYTTQGKRQLFKSLLGHASDIGLMFMKKLLPIAQIPI